MRVLGTSLGAAVAVATLTGSALTVAAQDGAGPDGLVTEEVEPGVERILRDDAGHDLDAKHPTNRYDMDGIAISPDGTVWLATTYSGSDNGANPRGAHAWALGQPGMATIDLERGPTGPISVHELSDGRSLVMAWGVPYATSDGDSDWTVLDESDRGRADDACRILLRGLTCVGASGEETTYLKGTPINQIAAAPDGTIWAVGGYDGGNGGLYRITLD